MNLGKMAKELGIVAESTNTHEQNSTQTENTFDKSLSLGPKKVYLSWEALSRPEMPELEPKVKRTLIVVGAFLGILLLMMQSYALILVVISIVLLTHALRQAPPEKVHYEISTHGVKFEDAMYHWEELNNYFDIESRNLNVIVITTKKPIPGRLYLTYNPDDRDTVINSIGNHLVFLEEEPKSWLDNAYEYVIDKLNLEE